MRYLLENPAEMTPSQRRREIAFIFAQGVLRLRSCATTSPVSSESAAIKKTPQSGRNCLDERAKKDPHGPVS